MASAERAHHGSYLFQRPGSSNWYVQLRSPDERKVVSLRTADKLQAQIAAAPMIAEHKAKLLAARPHLQTVRKLEPGEHAGPDGGKIVANERELIYLNHNGGYLRTEPNTMLAVIPPYPESSAQAVVKFIGSLDKPTRPVVAAKTADDDLLKTYLKQRGIIKEENGVITILDKLREKQAQAIWHTFKTVANKPIAKCTRDDGRAIVAQLVDQAGGEDEIKSATLKRRMVPLVATVNLAIEEGKLTFNPFAGCVPDRDDEEERDPFSDDDMKLIRANLRKLTKSDQLLVRLLATTGLRREEAFEIDGEQKENGIRFVTIGGKTPQSLRRVPFPKDLLPHLPKKITGQLIPGRMDTAGKRLKKWLIDIGVIKEDDGRDLAPMHSFRHRAAQRLRAAVPDESLREAVGGWANGKKKKTSRKYGNKHGAGFPLPMLKKAIDCIGF
jgi:integrase